MPLASETCRADLRQIDDNAAQTLAALGRADTEVTRLAKKVNRAKERVKTLTAKVDTLADEADAIEAEYDAVVANFDALLDQYGTFLPEPQYTQASDLEARARELEADYEAAVDEHNAAADRANDATAAANRIVGQHNAVLKRSRRLGKTAERRERNYSKTLIACLGETVSTWAGVVSPLETELAAAAATLATIESVSCDSPDEWQRIVEQENDPEYELDGYVTEGEKVVHLAPRVCHALAERLLDPHGRNDCYRASNRTDLRLCPPAAALLAGSIETLAHEAQHAKGIGSEARATCYGVQEAVGLGQASFGLRQTDARAMARLELTFVEHPPAYRSKQCHKGGELDLTPETPAWP